MFYILTFSYAVIVIAPLLICLLVPGTLSECGLALTYMSAFKSTSKKKQKKKKVINKKNDDAEGEEAGDEEKEEVEYQWSSHTALSRRLTELAREHFEGLFFDWVQPPEELSSSKEHSPSSTSTSSPTFDPRNGSHKQAAAWLRQTEHLLVQTASDWPSVLQLRIELQTVEREQSLAIASLQRSLHSLQKALLPAISGARSQQRQRQHQKSSSQLSHFSSDEELLERIETLIRGWCRRVKALKTLHV